MNGPLLDMSVTQFQEARRILNGEWHHLIYNEYLPVHLGEKLELKPLIGSHSFNYDSHLVSFFLD